MEAKFQSTLKNMDNVKRAIVNINVPENDGTLLSKKKESYASVMLELENPEEMTQDQAAFIARFVATELGNDTTANVVIMDTTGNMLYSGQDENSLTGNASSRLSYKTQYDNIVQAEINDALVGAQSGPELGCDQDHGAHIYPCRGTGSGRALTGGHILTDCTELKR